MPTRRACSIFPGVLTLVGALTPAAGAGVVLYVDDDAPPGGDGSSWGTAYSFLQDAMASATPPTEIRVAQGTYVPDRSESIPGGTGDREATFQLLSGVAILGGYAGIGAADPDERDVGLLETILSGDLAGDDGPGFANNHENSHTVVIGSDTDGTAVLDGVTIAAGNADVIRGSADPSYLGGGMFSLNGNLAVLNCTFRSNWAHYGGAIYIRSSSLSISNSTFSDNFAHEYGGGVRLFSLSTLDIFDSTFVDNTAVWGGGMAVGLASSATVTDCTFTGNLAGAGAGIYVDSESATVVTGSTFCDNSPDHIAGNWTEAGGNSFCALCDKSSGPVVEVPADYPTIQSAINAACDGSEVVVSPGTYYERIGLGGKAIIVRSTHGPDVTTIDGQGAGPVVLLSSGKATGTALEGFTIAGGSAQLGGGVWIDGVGAAIIDCHFRDNVADIGGAIHHKSPVGQLNLLRCVFDGNQALVSSGAIFSAGGLSAVDCVFSDNDGGQGPGAVGSTGTSASFVNCVFTGNSAEFIAGGVAEASNTMLMANCVFSRNSAGMAGGLQAGNSVAAITNCTFSLNDAHGVGSVGAALSNCILWGNTPAQIEELSAVVEHSDVQGGWPGTGNIDVDPLFVQPGTDDVRLAFGSPCVNAGDNASLPPDDLDLDGNGNTTEPIPYDLGGNARVQGGTVDMGAWEGEFEPGAPANGDNDLDQGEFVALVPEGGPFNPVQSPAVIVTNTSGPDNASFLVTQLEGTIHPGAEGFSELGAILRTETSLADGEYFATVYISFDAADLAGSPAQQLSLTYFDEAAGNWAFASSANSQPSPGFTGPIGNRIVELQGGAWGLTQELGDYGVFWDPQLQQGFVWANVEHEADFGVGFTFCPSDCLQTPDGLIGIQDMLALLSLWGAEAGGGPCDANFDGVIDQVDFGALLAAWGSCEVLSSAPAREAPPTPALATRSADLDGDGVVGRNDLLALKASWGECEGDCPGDLNLDGRVGITDWLSMLRDWGTPGELGSFFSHR